MVKFSCDTKDGTKLLGLGLSEENVKRLKEGKPILIKDRELKKIVGWDGHIVIMYGETEGAIAKDLQSHGLMPGDNELNLE